MDHANNFGQQLQYMINACASQAQWHHQQFTKLQYSQQYFAYLLQHQQFLDPNYLDNFLRSLNDQQGAWNPPAAEPPGHVTTTDQSHAHVTTTNQSPAHKKRKKKRKLKVKVHSGEDWTNATESESGLDLDDGYKQFLKESAKFRAERDAQKKKQHQTDEEGKEEDNIEVEYVDILHRGPEGTTLPPTAQNRKELYDKKYGEKGTTILSLETALQWKYNKLKDTCSPIMWPAIPLRLVYDDV